MTLRSRIRASRIPRRELARLLGVSFATVRAWITGERAPCCRHMERHAVKVLERLERERGTTCDSA